MSSSNRKSIDSLDSALSPLSAHASYPFPRIDTSQRVSAGPRSPSFRRGSNASISSFGSTTQSIGGSLDIRPTRTDSAFRETGQNAISNLLQPPIVRTGLLPHSANITPGYRAPTTRDIPPVTLTNIPHVENSAFKDYLTKVGPLFESISRRREDKDGKAGEGEESAPATPVVDRFARPGPSRQGSMASLSTPLETPHQRRRSSGHARRKLNEPTPLSTVPGVYFEEDFHLENPRTFDIVSERAEIVRPAPGSGEEKAANGSALPPRKALATNAILQEKLSWYMDTVEVHLINSISTASPSFFAALGSLRDLQREAEESAAQIQGLRAELAALDRGMVLGGLEISQLTNRRRNIGKLYRATEQVGRVIDRIVRCEEQVDEGDFEAAANGIEDTDRLVCGQSQPEADATSQPKGSEGGALVDLRELKVLQGLTPAIRDLHTRIGRGFESRFLETLMKDLRGHVDKVPHTDTIRRWANASGRYRADQKPSRAPTLYLDTGQDFRSALSTSLAGLDRAGYTGQAADAFRDATMKEMKSLIRRHLPSSSDEDAESVTSVATRGGRSATQQEKSAILARNLRALDEQDAEALLVGITTNVSEALRRLGVQTKVLLDVTSSNGDRSRAASPEPIGSPRMGSTQQSMDGYLKAPNGITSPLASPRLPPEVAQSLDMSSLLGQAVDVAQTQIVRVLKVRAEQTHKLPLERFVRYYTILRFFSNECEAISGRSGQTLINILNTQLTAFVSNMAETESQSIAQQLEADQWDAQDFQDKSQTILQRVLDGMSSDASIWTRGTLVWEDCSSEAQNGDVSTNGTAAKETGQDTKKAAAKPAYIDETRFILVKSAMGMLPIIDHFLALIASVPNIVPIVVPAMMEVLRTFNSRSSQLILGAGATRVAGLKNITTKHLALSSQALSFIIALTPYIREAVRRHAAGRNEALAEFDRVKRLFQDHQMGIHDKLVEIMTARARSHAANMRKIDFDAEKTDGPSPYMETLTKETGTLYRVLNRHLSEMDVTSIMMQIAKNYRDVWTSGISEVSLATEQGRQRLRKDVELFDNRLSKIDGFGDIGKALLENVNNRKIDGSAPKSEEAQDKAKE